MLWEYRRVKKTMNSKKRSLLIIAIILGAIILSALINLCITLVQSSSYPKEYSEYVEKYASEYNVPEYVIYAVIDTDSNFDPNKRYEDGSTGLMHLPSHILKKISSHEHLDKDITSESLTSPNTAIQFGTYYLRYLFDRYKTWDVAIVAYSAGELKTSEWLANPSYSKNGTTLQEIPLDTAEDYLDDVNDAIDYYKNKYYRNGVSVK